MKGFNKVTLLTAGLAAAMAVPAMATTLPRYDAEPNNPEYLQVEVDGTLYTAEADDIENTVEDNIARADHLEWRDLKWSNSLERIAEVRAAEVAVRLPLYEHEDNSKSTYWWLDGQKITQKWDSKWIFGDFSSQVARPSGETLDRMIVHDANENRKSDFEVVLVNYGCDITSALADENVGKLLAGLQHGEDGKYGTDDDMRILNIGAAAFSPKANALNATDGGSYIVLELNLQDKISSNLTITADMYKNGWRQHNDYAYDNTSTNRDPYKSGYLTPLTLKLGVKYNFYNQYLIANFGGTEAEWTQDLSTTVTFPTTVTITNPEEAWADQYKHEDAGSLEQLVTVRRGNIARLDVYKKGGDKAPTVTTAAKKYFTSLAPDEKIDLGVTATLKDIKQPTNWQSGFNTTRKYDVTTFATWTFVGQATKTITAPSYEQAVKNGIVEYEVVLGDYTKRAIQKRNGVITVTGYKTEAPVDDSLKNGDKFTATYQDTAIVYQVTDIAKKEAKVYRVANLDAAAVAVPASVVVDDDDLSYKFKVTAINGGAFKGMKNLETVSIGKNVKTIGRAAFWRDSKLATVIFNGSKTTDIAKNAFGKIAKDAVFTVKTDAEAKAVKAAVGFVSTQTVEQ